MNKSDALFLVLAFVVGIGLAALLARFGYGITAFIVAVGTFLYFTYSKPRGR